MDMDIEDIILYFNKGFYGGGYGGGYHHGTGWG